MSSLTLVLEMNPLAPVANIRKRLAYTPLVFSRSKRYHAARVEIRLDGTGRAAIEPAGRAVLACGVKVVPFELPPFALEGVHPVAAA